MDVSRRRDIGAIVRVMCEMEPSVYVMCFPFWVCIGQILNIPVPLCKGLLLCPLKLVAYGTSEYIQPQPHGTLVSPGSELVLPRSNDLELQCLELFFK